MTAREPSAARMFTLRAMGEDDEKLVFGTFGTSPGSAGGPFVSFVTAQRGPTGWTQTPISLPYSIDDELEPLFDVQPIQPDAFSEDLQTVLWLSAVPLAPGAPPTPELGLYRKAAGEAPEFIAPLGGAEPAFFYSGFVDIASDGGRVVFAGVEHLLPADAGRTSGGSIYTWDEGNLELVDVDNGGTLLSTCGTEISQENGMSASAELVFFTVPEGCGGTPGVYMRNLETETTVRISASQCTRGDCNAVQPVAFANATRDGSSVFLTTKQQLTNDDHDAGRDLYRYDVESGTLTLLSGGSAEAEGEVLTAVAYPSDDGSRVYFRATGVVLPGETTSGEKLFVADSGGTRLVAEASFTATPEIQLSANGSRVQFTTTSELVSGDTDSEPDAYIYDAGDESTTEISVGPSGGNGPFPVAIGSPLERPEFESTGDTEPFYSLDANGERAFFTTREPLLPEDHNTVADVYEWWNGQLGLLSSGEDEFDSVLAGASRDGRTAIVATNASLLPSDDDGGNRDYYAARIGGGFPEAEEEAEECDIAACPPPPREQLARPTLTSTSPPRPERGHIRVVDVRSKMAGVVGRSTEVTVEVPAPGLVAASVWIGGHGGKAVLARGRAKAKRPGRVRVELRLTRAGRGPAAAQARKGHLTVTEGKETVSQAVKLDLG